MQGGHKKFEVSSEQEECSHICRLGFLSEDREGSDAASGGGSTSRPETPPAKKRDTGDVRTESYEGLLRYSNVITKAQNMMRAVPDSEMSGEAVVLPAMPNEDTSKLPLLLEEGQVVEVQRRNDARPGWLEVTYRVKHGLFPESRLLLTRLLGELLKENPETLAKGGALELIQSHRRAVGETPSSPLGKNESIRGGKH